MERVCTIKDITLHTQEERKKVQDYFLPLEQSARRLPAGQVEFDPIPDDVEKRETKYKRDTMVMSRTIVAEIGEDYFRRWIACRVVCECVQRKTVLPISSHSLGLAP